MMYARKYLQPELVVLRIGLMKVFRTKGVIFSDGNAAAFKTKFFTYKDIAHLKNVLDWDILYGDNEYWKDENGEVNDEGIRKRCAEVLVPEQIPPKQIHSVVVQTDLIKTIAQVKIEGRSAPDVICKPQWFDV